jgi:LysM repeat protein
MKYIGIKLADNSFYPILEEGKSASKLIELTTATDNQSIVQIDLYRSESGTMEDAEYVDSLEITNLNAHKNGEPTLALNISLDEKNKLSAEIKDPETGLSSETAVTLVSRTLAERSSPTNFSLSSEIEEDLDDLNVSLMDEKTEQNVEEKSLEKPDIFAEENAGIDEPLVDLPDIDIPVAEENAISDSDLSSLQESSSLENNSNSLNTEDIFADTVEEDKDVIGSEPNNEDFAFDDLTTDSSVNEAQKNDSQIEEDTDFSFEEPSSSVNEDASSLDFDKAVQADTIRNEDNISQTLQDFESSQVSQESTSEKEDFNLDEELPEINETNSIDATSSLFNDSAYSTPSDVAQPLPSGLNDYFEDPAFNSSDDFKTDTKTDFDDLNLDDKELTFDSQSSSDDFNVDDLNLDSSIDSSVDNSSDFSASSSLDDDLFNTDGDLGVSSADEDVPSKKKTPLIIAIILAVLVLIGLALLLFVIPNQCNLLNKDKKSLDTEKTDTELSTAEVSSPAVEDEIVIAPSVEEVIPVVPETIVEKSSDIKYRIKWGDTLWDIADAFYKNPWRYGTIAKYNNIPNPDKIIAGTDILIPAE